MKTLYAFLCLVFFSMTGFSQVAKTGAQTPDPNQKLLVLETSCGECNYDLDGSGCDVAVKYDGKAYFVDGVGIYEYGHPHAKGGFCVAIRKAEVQGKLENGRFKVTYFKLLPPDDKTKLTN